MRPTTGGSGSAPPAPAGPGVLDALSLLAHVADELGVRSARDTHLAWTDRVRSVLPGGIATALPLRVHRGIAATAYAGAALGLRLTAGALDRVAAGGLGPRLEAGARGRFVHAAVNGLIGDRLREERPRLAISCAPRVDGRDVVPDPAGLARAYPAATGRLVVFLHGLCENEAYWNRRRDAVGSTYPETVHRLGWTPVLLRCNTGLALRECGEGVSGLLQRLVDAWPVEPERIVLVGHSMGGLVARAASRAGDPGSGAWTDLVSDVITLGTPHLGSPVATGIGHGGRGLGHLPETAAFGRILDWRSAGVHDLVAGLGEEVPALAHARYRLVAATLTRSERHLLGRTAGDLLVLPPSAYGRTRAGSALFPGSATLHLGRADHFDLLNHPRVHRALRDWLA